MGDAAPGVAHDGATFGVDPSGAPDNTDGELQLPEDPPTSVLVDAAASAPDSAPAQGANPNASPSVGAPTGSASVASTDVDCSNDPEVLIVLERYYADFATGDWNRVARHFWPNATIVTIRSPDLGAPPTVVSMRIEDYVARHADSGVRASALDISLDAPRVESIGSVASVFARYRALDPSGAEQQSWRGVDLFSLVRHDGEWRIASLVFEGARFGR